MYSNTYEYEYEYILPRHIALQITNSAEKSKYMTASVCKETPKPATLAIYAWTALQFFNEMKSKLVKHFRRPCDTDIRQ